MRAWGRIGVTIATLAFGLALPACGDDEGEDGVSIRDPSELIDRVPSDPSGLAFVDLAAVRQELGLPDDAGASQLGNGDGAIRVNQAASRAMPWLSSPRRTPLHEAIDIGAVVAAAANFISGPPGISVVETSQPFGEIAAALEDQGYKRNRDVLKADFFRQFNYNVVADGGDGVVVLGYDPDAVSKSVEGDVRTGNDPAGAAIEEVTGSARMAQAQTECIRVVAAGESFDPKAGELRVELEGDASSDSLRLADSDEVFGAEVHETEADGNVLTVELEPSADAGATFAPLAAVGLMRFDGDTVAPGERQIYAC